jgi:hypothetical protein
MEDVGIFYGPLEKFTASWYILWTFGTFCDQLVYFARFGILCLQKSGNSERRGNVMERQESAKSVFQTSARV